MPLQLKYRPKNLKQFAGNEELVDALETYFGDNGRNHSILIHGPSGCGKTTVARIIATRLGVYSPKNSRNMDFVELDSASFGNIDTIRDIKAKAMLMPTMGDYKVYMFDECHRLSEAAQEALLKVLEDYPNHVYFILATTNPEKLKITLKRRCATYEVRMLDEDILVDFMVGVLKKESVEVPERILREIALNSTGSLGIALSILDKVYKMERENMKKMVGKMASQENQVIDLCRALLQKSKWTTIASILKNLTEPEETIRRKVLGYCNTVLLGKPDPVAALIMMAFAEPFYDTGRPGLTLACWDCVVK